MAEKARRMFGEKLDSEPEKPRVTELMRLVAKLNYLGSPKEPKSATDMEETVAYHLLEPEEITAMLVNRLADSRGWSEADTDLEKFRTLLSGLSQTQFQDMTELQRRETASVIGYVFLTELPGREKTFDPKHKDFYIQMKDLLEAAL